MCIISAHFLQQYCIITLEKDQDMAQKHMIAPRGEHRPVTTAHLAQTMSLLEMSNSELAERIQNELAHMEQHMLHFLENHDEQRIASPEFAGDPRKGKPAMVISATISSAPTMLYFGQHVGEPAAEQPGFGAPSRTSIYDYVGVPHHQRWMNGGKFDGALLSAEEKDLNAFYTRLLNFTKNSLALTGEYREIHSHNRQHTPWYNDRVFSHVRWKDDQYLIIVCNFDAGDSFGFELQLPRDLMEDWKLPEGTHRLEDQLSAREFDLHVRDGYARARIDLEPLESFILQVK